MADINHSRFKRVTTSGNGVEIYKTATNLSSFALTPSMADVIVQFTDGPGGKVVWEAEADASSGTHFEDFSKPLLFKSGIWANILEDGPGALKSLCVGLVLPSSAGS